MVKNGRILSPNRCDYSCGCRHRLRAHAYAHTATANHVESRTHQHGCTHDANRACQYSHTGADNGRAAN